ncbi:MAG: S46 family peptidase [Bacteroidetes bacterium]|nr:S46 family peptidase [Bacteroidota bacterium]
MKKLFSLLISLILALNLNVKADEGMWMLPLLKKLNMGTMTELGLKLSAEEIYSINHSSIKDAIVIFGGGCTGEIVSDQGLLLTNHHCGYGRIQAHSSVEHNYLEDGFWAMSKEEELSNPGLGVIFLIKIEDVSEKINSALSDTMNEGERYRKIRDVSEEIQNAATEDNHYSARVGSFFGGNYFYLMVYETYNDVRFVGAPPSSIGKYGGDTDNWMWPRHTGDFSVFRVYSGPDGKPAEYSEDNIPLKPKHYLPVSVKGVEPDDFAMALGYPGGTQRYMTSYGIEEQLQITHPNRIKVRGVRQELMMQDMEVSEKVRIQYASKYSGSSNYWKFSIGQSESLKRLKIKQKKQKIEDKFSKWIAADPVRNEKYGEALDLIKNSIEGRAEFQHSQQYLMECLLRGSEVVGAAMGGGTLLAALQEEDQEKTDEAIEQVKERMGDFFKNYNMPTDRKINKAMFRLFAENVDSKYHPDIYKTINGKFKGDYEKFVDKMFDKSIFVSEERLTEFLNNPNAKILEKDVAFQAAISILNKFRELRQKTTEFDMNLDKGRRLFIAGLLEMQKGDVLFYPDANFTMRLTYGTVSGYDAKDAVWFNYYTTLEGVMEKEDPDNYEFIVDEKLKKLYEEKDYGRYADENGYMPVCFLTNNDITGGNSGSPVLNDNGELIGLAFDGNWEAMSGDITFEEKLQRCIVVDIRYVLFIMDKYAGAKNLIEEMDIVM